MIIYEYFINLMSGISNPGGYGGGKTIDGMLDNGINKNIKERTYKIKLKKALNLLELKKNDYILLKETSDVLLEKFSLLNDKLKEKDMQINQLTELIDKYENAFLKFEKDKKNMIDILDSYKNNLQKLMDGKDNAVKTLDMQANEILRLKRINLKMLAELKKYKKD